jgi:hypothetical protein
MDEYIYTAMLALRDWAKRVFVVPGVDFDVICVGFSETSEYRFVYFKIRYTNGETSEGNIFEARFDKKTSKATYSAFEAMGIEP